MDACSNFGREWIDTTLAACQKGRARSHTNFLCAARMSTRARIHQSRPFIHSLVRSLRPAKQCDTKDVRRELKGVPPIAPNAWLEQNGMHFAMLISRRGQGKTRVIKCKLKRRQVAMQRKIQCKVFCFQRNFHKYVYDISPYFQKMKFISTLFKGLILCKIIKMCWIPSKFWLFFKLQIISVLVSMFVKLVDF